MLCEVDSRCKYNSGVGGTRKIVNYACGGGRPWKRGWMTETVLMCNSLVGRGHSGERPNEQSGSWFQPKCLAGQRRIIVSREVEKIRSNFSKLRILRLVNM